MVLLLDGILLCLRGQFAWVLLCMSASLVVGVLTFHRNKLLLHLTEGGDEAAAMAAGFIKICVLQVASDWLNAACGLLIEQKVVGRIQQTLLVIYLDKLMNCSMSWQTKSQISELQTAINSGIQTQLQLIQDGLRITRPVVAMTVAVFNLMQIIGSDSWYHLAYVGVLMACGLRVKYTDYVAKKEISTSTNHIQNDINNLWRSFWTRKLNGFDPTSQIKQLTTTEADLYRKRETRNTIDYALIDTLQSIGLCCFALHLTTRIDNVQRLALVYMHIRTTIDYVWWIFQEVGSMASSASKFGPLEELLKSYKAAPASAKTQLVSATHAPRIGKHISKTSRSSGFVAFSGISGSGKTRLMKQVVESLYCKYEVGWLYLDQNMEIVVSKDATILSYMTEGLVAAADAVILRTLLSWASWLMIEHIININTIKRPFVHVPSGGETKRILILKNMLRILFGTRQIKMLFLDEVTAGLDTVSWARVHDLLRHVSSERKVWVVMIDHRAFKADVQLRCERPNNTVLNALSLTAHLLSYRIPKPTEDSSGSSSIVQAAVHKKLD